MGELSFSSLVVFSGSALWSIALVSHREGIPEVSAEPLICELHCPKRLCLLFSLHLSLSIPSLSRLVLHNHLFYSFFLKRLKGLIMYIDNPYKLLFWGLFIDFQARLPSGISINHL